MNSINNITSTQAAVTAMETTIKEAYESYVYSLVNFSMGALSFYTTMLEITREIEHIWVKPFGLPSLLYVFGRYGNLISQGFYIGAAFVPVGRNCDNLANATNSTAFLTSTGIQGLLVSRAYALSQSRIMSGFLVFSFLSELCLNLLTIILINECTPTFSESTTTLTLLTDISVIVPDLLIFCICLRNVWGTWKLKRESGIQGRNDLVSIFLKQIISRFCFVLAVTVIATILSQTDLNVSTASSLRQSPIISYNLISFQNVLSVIMVTDFTLELRQRNSALIRASNISLPTLQFSSILQHVHRTLTVEMGDHDNMNLEGENGIGLRSPDGELTGAQNPLGTLAETTEARAV